MCWYKSDVSCGVIQKCTHPELIITAQCITAESSSAVKVFKRDAENKNKRKNTLKCVQKELKKWFEGWKNAWLWKKEWINEVKEFNLFSLVKRTFIRMHKYLHVEKIPGNKRLFNLAEKGRTRTDGSKLNSGRVQLEIKHRALIGRRDPCCIWQPREKGQALPPRIFTLMENVRKCVNIHLEKAEWKVNLAEVQVANIWNNLELIHKKRVKGFAW